MSDMQKDLLELRAGRGSCRRMMGFRARGNASRVTMAAFWTTKTSITHTDGTRSMLTLALVAAVGGAIIVSRESTFEEQSQTTASRQRNEGSGSPRVEREYEICYPDTLTRALKLLASNLAFVGQKRACTTAERPRLG